MNLYRFNPDKSAEMAQECVQELLDHIHGLENEIADLENALAEAESEQTR